MKKLIPFCAVLLLALVGFGLYHVASVGKKSDIYLSGTVSIDPALLPFINRHKTVFLILYNQDSPMPMPFGAVKENISSEDLKKGKFDFFITKEKLQTMNPNALPPKNFRLKIRIDRDGLGGRDQSGDLTGEVTNLPFGTSAINLNIKKLVN